MRQTTDALILRENNHIGEADRFVTALTRDFGIIRAAARGARSLSSRKSAATQLLCYARLVLYKGRSQYIIDDAKPIEVFFGLRNDIVRLTLGQYFCELAGLLGPREEPAPDCLRLMLGGLYHLSNGKKDIRLVKAVVELRLLTLAGYMPALNGCAQCRDLQRPPEWLLPREGTLRCAACGRDQDALPLSPALLTALRHIVHAPLEKVFAFTLSPSSLEKLSHTAEVYLLTQLGRGFRTLDFYHTLGHLGP